MVYYLAIDIGASGGRHILGHLEDNRLITEEIYRFENGVEKNAEGQLIWDTEKLFAGVLAGLARCREEGKIPKTVAIDTWGVDYCLLDEADNLIAPAYAYRDGKRAEIVPEVDALLPRTEVYRLTGIQFQPFNTLYQLCCDREKGRLDRAKIFLQMPDYLAFRLTGKAVNEYTNATTTSLVNAVEKTWDRKILEKLGLKASLFGPLTLPGKTVGPFSSEIEKTLGFSACVVTCPSHDTASAYAATLGLSGGAILSSGTWSLIGMEQTTPITTPEAREANFTNEGGVEYRYRFLKNIMGMWLLQSIRKEIGQNGYEGKAPVQYSYNTMMDMAAESGFVETFDVNHPSLSAPDNMIASIKKLLGKTSMPLGDLLASVYRSLAHSYQKAIGELEALTGDKITSLQIVGGGSSDAYLNRLTREYTGIPVLTGPKEATAIGNLACQIMADRGLSLKEVRSLIQKSFAVSEVN